MVAKYSEKLKRSMVRRLVGPSSVSASQLAKEVGISQASLSRWLQKPGNLVAMTNVEQDQQATNVVSEPRRPQDWSPAERLAVVLEARGIAEENLGAFLRRKGLHEADLGAWRRVALEAAETALAGQGRGKAQLTSPEGKRVKELERELKDLHAEMREQERALAKVTALLVLKKKVDLLYGDADDNEPGRSGK